MRLVRIEGRPGLGFGLEQSLVIGWVAAGYLSQFLRDQYAGGTIRLWLNPGGGLTTLTKLIIPLSS